MAGDPELQRLRGGLHRHMGGHPAALARSQPRDRGCTLAVPRARRREAPLPARAPQAGADQPRQLEHGRPLPRAPGRAQGPARPALRLPHQRRALPPMAGASPRAPAEDPAPVGTERHHLHARRRTGVPPRPARRRAAHARHRPLRPRGLARRDGRVHQALLRHTGRRAGDRRGRGERAMRVLSVNVGLPREIVWRGKPVTTGIWKQPVAGRVPLRTLNLDRDGQADLRVHGGRDKAVYAYPSEFYELWRRERPELDLPWGTFGENLTTEGLPDGDVCVGDRFRIGTAELVVTEPRLPCFKLGIRMGRAEFVTEFLDRRLYGFYLAVIREGDVAAGDPIVELARDPRHFGVTEVARLYASDRDDLAGMRQAAAHDALPEPWREYFRKRLAARAA